MAGRIIDPRIECFILILINEPAVKLFSKYVFQRPELLSTLVKKILSVVNEKIHTRSKC